MNSKKLKIFMISVNFRLQQIIENRRDFKMLKEEYPLDTSQIQETHDKKTLNISNLFQNMTI